MVAPHKLSEFYEIIDQADIFYELLIDNVQELVNRTTTEDNLTGSKYYTNDELFCSINYLVNHFADKAEFIWIGESYENISIYGVKVSFNKANPNPGIVLEGGIHANEWISPSTVLYILDQLLTSNDPDVRALAESHDWYVFPLLNPDGYKYTHTTVRLIA